MTLPDPLPCPNPDCQSAETYIAVYSHYVVCRKCHMTGPVGQNDEEAVRSWNRLPRFGVDLIMERPRSLICDKCGCEINPELNHFCMFTGQL